MRVISCQAGAVNFRVPAFLPQTIVYGINLSRRNPWGILRRTSLKMEWRLARLRVCRSDPRRVR
jgi:hypothetical protein